MEGGGGGRRKWAESRTGMISPPRSTSSCQQEAETPTHNVSHVQHDGQHVHDVIVLGVEEPHTLETLHNNLELISSEGEKSRGCSRDLISINVSDTNKPAFL